MATKLDHLTALLVDDDTLRRAIVEDMRKSPRSDTESVIERAQEWARAIIDDCLSPSEMAEDDEDIRDALRAAIVKAEGRDA